MRATLNGASHPLVPSFPTTVRRLTHSLPSADLCLQKQRGTWAPSAEALRSFQQRRFTSLDGAAESMGDLKSIVLHNMEVRPHRLPACPSLAWLVGSPVLFRRPTSKSTFPMSLGAKVTGVDDHTYSATGEAFSAIILPNAETTTHKKLQADDVSLAYEFAKKCTS